MATTYTPVPKELPWEGKFTCVGCHNPHPSNANSKYLVSDTKDGAEMGSFCATCHPSLSDKVTIGLSQQMPVNSDPNAVPIVKAQPGLTRGV